jgi:CarD family transcriptional regulator
MAKAATAKTKTAAKKPAAKKPAAKGGTSSVAVKKATPKTAAKKPVAKKPAVKKAAPKAAAKKAAPKVVTKKAAPKVAAPKAVPKTAAPRAASKTAAKKPSAKKPAAKKSAAKTAAESIEVKAPAPKAAVPKNEKLEFAVNDFVVYPTHGVGQVTGVENYEIAGENLRLFVISFERERMTLKVPITKVKESGLRKLSSRKVIDNALKTLKGRVRIKRTMWSRRAQEYDAKINSGDAVAIAEVVRDLHRGADQPDQSYSERQMYQAALERLSRELGAVEKTEPEEAVEKIEAILAS